MSIERSDRLHTTTPVAEPLATPDAFVRFIREMECHVVPVPDKEEEMEKNKLRPKKLTLKVETLRLLEADQLAAVQGGGILTIATTVFSEGACEGYSWLKAC